MKDIFKFKDGETFIGFYFGDGCVYVITDQRVVRIDQGD